MSELRTELWEKELKLTDIRLEALGSAHRLEQLQDAMNNMQVCSYCSRSSLRINLSSYLLLILKTMSQAYYLKDARSKQICDTGDLFFF